MGISEAGEMGLGLTSSITSEVLGIKAISSNKDSILGIKAVSGVIWAGG